MAISDVTIPNDLDSLWMPFTDNRSFKKQPKLFSEAEGMYYITPEGRRVLDGTSGLSSAMSPSVIEECLFNSTKLKLLGSAKCEGTIFCIDQIQEMESTMQSVLQRIWSMRSQVNSVSTLM